MTEARRGAVCPACRAPVDGGPEGLFCAACRGVFASPPALAASLGVVAGDPRIAPVLVRPIAVVGACPTGDGGALERRRIGAETVGTCRACGGIWVARGGFGRLRAAVPTLPSPDALLGVGATRTADGDAAAMATYADEFQRAGFAYDTPLVNAVAVPGALALGLLAKVLGFGILVYATASMWTHELGHTAVAWLAGFAAVPLPFFTATPSDDERSVVVIAVVSAAIVALVVYAWRSRRKALGLFGLALAAAQATLTWGQNPAQAFGWVLRAGLGGEIGLATILILAFYQRLPGRWDFWRFLVLAVGAVAYVRAAFLWWGVTHGVAAIPHGSALGDDSNGDVERLVRTYKETHESLAGGYLTLTIACGGLIAVAYAAGLLRARRA